MVHDVTITELCQQFSMSLDGICTTTAVKRLISLIAQLICLIAVLVHILFVTFSVYLCSICR